MPKLPFDAQVKPKPDSPQLLVTGFGLALEMYAPLCGLNGTTTHWLVIFDTDVRVAVPIRMMKSFLWPLMPQVPEPYRCQACQGTGMIGPRSMFPQNDCQHCGGSGVAPTEPPKEAVT